MKGLLGAVSFLTRIPTGTGVAAPGAVAGFVPWFPVVGAAIGLLVAAAYGGALLLLPAAAVAVLAGVALTGAFHEDGLGDTADAFAGGRDREEVLRILEDPRLGTFGVVAVTGSLLLRVAAVAALAPSAALAALPAAHALSRAAAVAVLAGFPPAAGTGLGATSARALSGRQALAGVAAGAAAGGLLLGGWALPAGALAGLGGWLLARLALRRIGGISGDLLGAVQQQAEVLVLLVAVAAGTWRSPVSSLIALVSGSA